MPGNQEEREEELHKLTWMNCDSVTFQKYSELREKDVPSHREDSSAGSLASSHLRNSLIYCQNLSSNS